MLCAGNDRYSRPTRVRATNAHKEAMACQERIAYSPLYWRLARGAGNLNGPLKDSYSRRYWHIYLTNAREVWTEGT